MNFRSVEQRNVVRRIVLEEQRQLGAAQNHAVDLIAVQHSLHVDAVDEDGRIASIPLRLAKPRNDPAVVDGG
jgi:hypothetical protein